MRKRVTLVCSDVSSNCLGRTWLLARMIHEWAEAEIVGPAFGNAVWEPLSGDKSVPIRYVAFENAITFGEGLRKLLRMIDGDVIYANKPTPTSYLVALLAARGRPLVLDIDDWEMAFVIDHFSRSGFRKFPGAVLRSAVTPLRVGGVLGTWIAEKLVFRADMVTVSNRSLQRKFGGILIPHGRDAAQFSFRDEETRQRMRVKLGIGPGDRVVVFAGTPRPHKGLEVLISAMEVNELLSALLLVVGASPADPFSCLVCELGRARLGKRFLSIGMVPFDELPGYVCAGDVIAIPQDSSGSAKGQLPAKLFDAMALERPIVATAVSDIAEIVGEGGWVVPPDDAPALARAITEALENPNEARRRARIARQRFVDHYSWQVLGVQLKSVFGQWLS